VKWPILAQLRAPSLSIGPNVGSAQLRPRPHRIRRGLFTPARGQHDGNRLGGANGDEEPSGICAGFKPTGLLRQSLRDSLTGPEMNKPSPPAIHRPSSRLSERPPRSASGLLAARRAAGCPDEAAESGPRWEFLRSARLLSAAVFSRRLPRAAVARPRRSSLGGDGRRESWKDSV
jgi:hypothetical protein